LAPEKQPAIDSPTYWDEQALLKEELRQFDVCQGCRLCWNFCPTFPLLFEKTDAVNAEMSRITRRDLRAVEDSCYQCKLCYIRCPYIPPHHMAMDVPRLLTRAKLVNRKKDGVPWQDRVLADTDGIGKMGGLAAPVANLGNRAAPVRFVLEKILGVHHKANLPTFHSRTFASWFRQNGAGLSQGLPVEAKKVGLFYTCSVNYNDPAVGIAAAQVLAHNGVRVTAPEQQCCGMPFLDAGALDRAKGKVDANVRSLAALVRQGHDVVVLSPSCSLTMKKEYPHLSSSEDTQLVASHTFDISEYLWKLKVERKLKTDFKNEQFRARVKSIAYHVPCHIRAQFMGNKAANLMELIPDMTVHQIEKCSAHDGTWGVKKGSYTLSMRYGQKLFDAMREVESDLFVSDCPLASNQIESGTETRPVHPVQVLKEAYGIEP